MPIVHSVLQRSEAWDRLRLGIPTSSCFDKIITPGGKDSAQWDTYACHLIAERLLGERFDTYTSPWMERGADEEEAARKWYEFDRDVDVECVGFVTTDDGGIGCSPDFLVGSDGLGEIKIPSPATQIRYLVTGQYEKTYKPQVQGQLWISERAWVDVIAWHDKLPKRVIRVERDEAFIVKLADLVTQFREYIDAITDKIKSLGWTPASEPVTAPKEKLREMLQRTLQREIVP